VRLAEAGAGGCQAPARVEPRSGSHARTEPPGAAPGLRAAEAALAPVGRGRASSGLRC
jgi:hypothetical protein